MQKVVVYRSGTGGYVVVNVPDSYTTGHLRPVPQSTDRYYDDRAAALAELRRAIGAKQWPWTRRK